MWKCPFAKKSVKLKESPVNLSGKSPEIREFLQSPRAHAFSERLILRINVP